MAKVEKWLQVVVEDAMPQLYTVPRCMTLCDLTPDNYTRLVVVDMTDDIVPNASLKVFRGTKLVYERPLAGVPCAIESLYTDYTEVRTPIIALAIGSEVLFFRNLKPYFKYTLPELQVEQAEQDLLRKLPLIREDQQAEVIEELRTLDFTRLTPRSQKLLQITNELERQEFIKKYADALVERRAQIVAMSKLNRVCSNEQTPPSHLVLATDNGDILVLEMQSFAVLCKAKTAFYETTPSLMAVHGTYETEFYIVVASRYGSIYLLRKSVKEGIEICKLPEPATELVLLPVDQTIMVSCMSKRLMCYSKKGKQLFCNYLPARPVCMIPISLMHLGMTLTCVALEGGLVQFYLQRHLVDEFSVPCTVIAMCFGRMGLEDHVLTLVNTQGGVIIKILKRQANFDPVHKKAFMSREQEELVNAALDKSKKNSIFVEQANREKQNSKGTYGAFQAGLWRLRHLAARSTVDVIESNESSMSSSFTHATVKLTAEVCGLGPEYRLYLIVHNMSDQKIANNLMLLLHADRNFFALPKSSLNLPSILPQIPLHVDFKITVIVDPFTKLPPNTLITDNSNIRVLLVTPGQTKPLIAATVVMPLVETKT